MKLIRFDLINNNILIYGKKYKMFVLKMKKF